MNHKTSLRLLPALLAVAFSGAAGAAGFQLLEQNASGIGNSYAGSAAIADNASTVFFNPAGMTQLAERQYSVGGTMILPSYKFTNGTSSTGVLTGTGGDAGHLALVPNGFMSWPIGPSVWAGLGISVPFGMKTDYDNPWLGAAQSRKFEVKTINLNPSIAYKLNDTVSLGFGVNYQKLDAEYVRTAGVATVGGIPLSASTVTLTLSDSAWGWNVGALFTVSPATKIGVSYRSAIQYSTSGNVAVSGPAAPFNAARSGTAAADIKLPDTLIFSLTHQVNDKWQMLVDLSRTGWNSIPKVDIWTTTIAGTSIAQTLDTVFQNSYRAALGANYKYSDTWTLKFGTAYDQTVVPDAAHRLVSLPDNDRIWVSFGAQYKPSKSSTLDLGAAYLFIRDAGINNNQAAAARGLVNGTYSGSVALLGVQYSSAF